MPEVLHTTTVAAPLDAVWAFVSDMDNWAPFLTGYQKHEKKSETVSVWTLKGDVGVLSRRVELEATVVEWCAPERVRFTLRGLNEVVEGGGTLLVEPTRLEATRAPPPRLGLFARFVRWLVALVGGRRAPPALGARADATASGEGTRLTFRLRMDAGGPTGPLVNAMLGPLLSPAAEQLADEIVRHVETARKHA